MATTAQVKNFVTADDLLKIPDDGFRYELIRGELKQMAPAGFEHGRIAAILTASLVQHVMPQKLGVVCAAETGFKISSNPDHVRAPDVAFIANHQLLNVKDVKGFWPGTPDLVIEVVSPNDAYADVEEKVLDWLDAGCRMVIVVNPRKQVVTVYRTVDDIHIIGKGAELHGADVLPGWCLAVDSLFT